MNNFLKTAVRHLFKNRLHALINLFGLSLGLTVSILIYLFVQDELSFDKYVAGYEDVFRIQTDVVTGSDVQTWASSEGYLVPAISSGYPEVVAATRTFPITGDVLFRADSTRFSESNTWAADTTFFDVFVIPFVYGDPETALDGPESIVISRTLAEKFFGKIDPTGKILTTENSTYHVTGVMNDMPDASHFHASAIISLKSFWPDIDEVRNMLPIYSYVRARPGQSKSLAEKLRKDSSKISGVSGTGDPNETRIVINPVPLSDIHLMSRFEKEIEPNGNRQIVLVFAGAAILILLIASVNYINLSNALAIRRAKEIAVRKTIGATRRGLFIRFLLETYLFLLLAFVTSLTAVIAVIPWFNTLTGKDLSAVVLLQDDFLVFLVVGWVLLGFLAGLYPATLLSSFNPVQALRSGFSERSGKTSLNLRRAFIIFQFTVAAMMIVCTVTIKRQMGFIEGRDIGFKKENVIVLPLAGDARDKLLTLKQQLENIPAVESTSAMSVVPGKRVVVLTVRMPHLAGTRPSREGSDDGTREMRVLSVDHDVVKTLGLQLIAGREFYEGSDADGEHGFIVNESAVREFDLKDPVGTPFEYTFGDSPKKGKIIAVVRDFNFASVHNPVEPLMMHIMPWYSVLCVRIASDNIKQEIADIESAWKNVSSAPFNYSFLDSSYDMLYKSDRATGRIVSYFTVLAMVIACLGLFGVISFFARQRVKDVAVRKVFGASSGSLLAYLSREYVIMVAVGNILAIYPAWFIADQWLQQFAYRIDLSPLTFLVTLIGSAVVAFISMMYVLAGVARTNPAVVLKAE